MKESILSFAIQAHQNKNHFYDGNKPYAVHLAMVVDVAYGHIGFAKTLGINPNVLIEACWLHDVIEDCRVTYNDVKKVAGEQVADIVYAVTNEKGKNRAERGNDKYYEGIRATKGAPFVKMCDRIANVSYSFQTKSRMFRMYQKENQKFLNQLSASATVPFNMLCQLEDYFKTEVDFL